MSQLLDILYSLPWDGPIPTHNKIEVSSYGACIELTNTIDNQVEVNFFSGRHIAFTTLTTVEALTPFLEDYYRYRTDHANRDIIKEVGTLQYQEWQNSDLAVLKGSDDHYQENVYKGFYLEIIFPSDKESSFSENIKFMKFFSGNPPYKIGALKVATKHWIDDKMYEPIIYIPYASIDNYPIIKKHIELKTTVPDNELFKIFKEKSSNSQLHNLLDYLELNSSLGQKTGKRSNKI